MTFRGRKFDSRYDQQFRFLLCRGGDRWRYVTDFVVVGYGDDLKAFLRGGGDDRFRGSRLVFNVVATKITMHMKISADEASATWQIINFRNRSHGPECASN